jgi:hypothetical protein
MDDFGWGTPISGNLHVEFEKTHVDRTAYEASRSVETPSWICYSLFPVSLSTIGKALGICWAVFKKSKIIQDAQIHMN